MVTLATIAFGPTVAPGNFTLPHGLGTAPRLVMAPRLKSAGAVWFQTPGWDAANLYLTASAANLSGEIDVCA